jgi:transcriptional regulator GlxA family with amidase domain
MIQHVVFDGVSDGALGVALDVVSAAARLARSGVVAERVLRQRVVSIDGRPVRTAAGRRVKVDGVLSRRAGRGDVLVLPGLWAASERETAALLARRDIQLGADRLASASHRGATLAASCSATFVLGAAGVLDGRDATTTWWLTQSFVDRFPGVTLRSDRMVIDAGPVLTAGAAFAHADLMLTILARVASPTLAHLVAKYLLLDERVSQSRYLVMEHLRAADPVVLTLERFVANNLRRQVSVGDMARATATSPRTLARKLASALNTTPLHFAQRVRVTHAAHLLETTKASVEEIAARVGYADAAAFRRVFRRETGESPRSRLSLRALRGSRGASSLLRRGAGTPALR